MSSSIWLLLVLAGFSSAWYLGYHTRLKRFAAEKLNSRRAKKCLAPINQLNQYALYNTTMKKYICILASAALLAACEQKTETTEPAESPAATTPAKTTETISPAATSPESTSMSPAESGTSPAESPTP